MNWRPKDWESQPPITDYLSLSTRRIFEAGADAMLIALHKLARKKGYGLVKGTRLIYLPEEVINAKSARAETQGRS